MTHISDNDGDPRVWLLTEGDGGFGVLVDGDRLRLEHLDAVRTRTRQAINSLESDLRKLSRDERDRAEGMLERMQVFDLKLGLLYEGRAPEAQIRYPGLPSEDQPKDDPCCDNESSSNSQDSPPPSPKLWFSFNGLNRLCPLRTPQERRRRLR